MGISGCSGLLPMTSSCFAISRGGRESKGFAKSCRMWLSKRIRWKLNTEHHFCGVAAKLFVFCRVSLYVCICEQGVFPWAGAAALGSSGRRSWGCSGARTEPSSADLRCVCVPETGSIPSPCVTWAACDLPCGPGH